MGFGFVLARSFIRSFAGAHGTSAKFVDNLRHVEPSGPALLIRARESRRALHNKIPRYLRCMTCLTGDNRAKRHRSCGIDQVFERERERGDRGGELESEDLRTRNPATSAAMIFLGCEDWAVGEV